MLSIKLSLVTFLTFSEASPLGSGSEAIFASPPKLPKAERDLPIVDLPSGRYRASKYVKKLDVMIFLQTEESTDRNRPTSSRTFALQHRR